MMPTPARTLRLTTSNRSEKVAPLDLASHGRLPALSSPVLYRKLHRQGWCGGILAFPYVYHGQPYVARADSARQVFAAAYSPGLGRLQSNCQTGRSVTDSARANSIHTCFREVSHCLHTSGPGTNPPLKLSSLPQGCGKINTSRPPQRDLKITRIQGCSSAIAINLGFAGVLSLLCPA